MQMWKVDVVWLVVMVLVVVHDMRSNLEVTEIDVVADVN